MTQSAATSNEQAPFQGKAALIYGGAKGIGRAVALEFARRGARVAVADIDVAGASETAAAIAATGRQSVALRCDVTNDLSVREAAVGAELALGEIDIVMNNVGAILNGHLEDIPLAEWERIISLNLLSVVRSNGIWVAKMLARGRGHIVNTGSFAGMYPFAASRMPYVAAKAGVIALSESMALYLHPHGIRVSCLCPGPVMTQVMESMKTWSTNVVMRGPGSNLTVRTVDQVATRLADGMRDGQVIIPTDDAVWETLRQHAADPDAFIRSKIDEFARGDHGRPTIARGD
ncbi:MAG TPA: SDR family oxidoreductase [Steroidobacteraceae bacterium]|jgi:NAD(P)-dependent dehydrogenase (short-subunit alcohol dehydrogenase family)|nr:SDR family oxidoreductase [Steroidobacteraceae bacterium]